MVNCLKQNTYSLAWTFNGCRRRCTTKKIAEEREEEERKSLNMGTPRKGGGQPSLEGISGRRILTPMGRGIATVSKKMGKNKE